MEALTARTVEAVREMVTQIAAQGGVIAAVESGWVEARVHEGASRIQAQTDSGERAVIGVNRFRVPHDDESESLDVDARKVRSLQVDRLRRLRAGRDQQRVCATLERLAEVARSGEGNLLAATIDAMHARATVGECTSALEQVWPRWSAPVRADRRAWARARASDTAWEAAKDAVTKWRRLRGRAPRIVLLKLGQDGHDRGVRVVAAALADAGFETEIGPLFATPEQAVQWTIPRAPDVVGVSTLAGAHLSLVPELLERMRATHIDAPVVVGGIVPRADHARLVTLGVAAQFGPGTPLDNIVHKLLSVMTHVTTAPA